jgi:L-alanine-DL-glutamate epimerase-like enolase superfamily enzyme
VTDRFTLASFEFFVRHTRTRFPFRYGIASMTDVPHLFLRAPITSGATMVFGVTAEGLPPKWFTKDPTTTFEQDLPQMLEVIGHAARLAEEVSRTPIGFFDFWRELDLAQEAWASARGIAPLLAHHGVSLVERAVLDGLCRIAGEPLHRMISGNRLGLRLGDVYAELGDAQPSDLLPAAPLEACFLRHTIGLGDALTPGDMSDEDRVDDGLPQDLESSIRAYGLRYFKVKLSGVAARDVPRLEQMTDVLERETGGNYRVTLDGNENFGDVGSFRQFWEQAATDPSLQDLWHRIVIVEQPVHRDRALGDETGEGLRGWRSGPPMIVDESDGAIGDVPRALELGYAGASFKSCKGIVKGLANACLLAKRRGEGRAGELTGEDLCTLGPFALLQDLAMMALLGISHVERNGHHYYRGLSMWPSDWQEAMLASHDDLYSRHPDGFARLTITDGTLSLASVNTAPLGVRPVFDPSVFARQPMP